MSHHHDHPNERIPLMAVAGLIAVSVIAIFAGRLSGAGLQERAEPALVESRALVFSDGEGGDVDVHDYLTGEEVMQYGTGEGGFERTALRALAYSRQLNDVGSEAPFVVGRAEDGRVVLHDPETSKTITLSAFGDAQVEAFASLLDARGEMR